MKKILNHVNTFTETTFKLFLLLLLCVWMFNAGASSGIAATFDMVRNNPCALEAIPEDFRAVVSYATTHFVRGILPIIMFASIICGIAHVIIDLIIPPLVKRFHRPRPDADAPQE
jgi:hypothetical protein